MYIYIPLRIRFQQKGFSYKYYLTGKEVVVDLGLNIRIHRDITGEVGLEMINLNKVVQTTDSGYSGQIVE